MIIGYKLLFFVEHKNTTGLIGYDDTDVDYNCIYENSDENPKLKIYSDLIFDYQGEYSDYQLKTFSKMILEYSSDVTDEDYKKFIEQMNSIGCLTSDCTLGHLELSISLFGFDTVVDRKTDSIEVTYNNVYGMGEIASKEYIKKQLKEFNDKGYVCK